ncbi:hypothetical protein CR513_09944, partial [Mucuna pruriens]
MRIWCQIAPGSKTWSKENKKASKNTLKDCVQPPITEKEMVTMFIDTLPSPYYDKVVGNVTSNFADLVVVGERIELGLRWQKFAKQTATTTLLRSPYLRRRKAKPMLCWLSLSSHKKR